MMMCSQTDLFTGQVKREKKKKKEKYTATIICRFQPVVYCFLSSKSNKQFFFKKTLSTCIAISKLTTDQVIYEPPFPPALNSKENADPTGQKSAAGYQQSVMCYYNF